jgi:large subunit ribosomal protein L25
MPEFDLNAELRTDVGKGASRRLRRAGRLPAIVYGGDKQPTPVTLDQNELARRLEHEAFYSHVLTLRVGGESESVVLKDILHPPFRRQVLHVDLQRVTESRRLHMHVPLHFVNEDTCPGRKAGGTISHTMNEIEVMCLPKDLPEFIAVDLAGLELGQAIHLSGLALPAGVELAHPVTPDTDRAVVSVQRHGGGEEVAAPAAEATPGAVGGT